MKNWLSGLMVALAAGIGAIATPAVAQEFPTREVRLVCGFVAGSGADVMHRYFAKQLQALTGKTFIVDNQPGVAGNLAHSYAARARADGYVVYPVGGSTLAASLYIFKKPPVDPLKDFEYIGTLIKQGWFVVVDAKSPIKTLPELTAFLKQKKDKASFSTATTIANVMGKMYKQIAGLEAVQVQYKTIGDSLNDLLSGNIDFMLADAAFMLGQVNAGRVRVLAISTTERMKSVPDIPTMAEGGVPGIDLMVWWTIAVPAGTPQPVKDKLTVWFNQMLRMKETEDFLANIGTDVFISTPEETNSYLRQEIKNWGEHIKRAGIEPT